VYKWYCVQCSIAHSIICTRLFREKMHSDWFNGMEILQGRWQHGEKVGYSYPSGLEKTLCKWDIYVLLVMKGLIALVAAPKLSQNMWRSCFPFNSVKGVLQCCAT
jgi:hypothetical protein